MFEVIDVATKQRAEFVVKMLHSRYMGHFSKDQKPNGKWQIFWEPATQEQNDFNVSMASVRAYADGLNHAFDIMTEMIR